MEYLPFTPDMIRAASELLAQRHQRNRLSSPELPARFEDPAVAARALQVSLARPGAGGFAAIRDGQLVAYLLGETSVQSWGRCGHIYLPGCAVAAGESPATTQDIYARLGETWNRQGCFNHYIYLPASEEALIGAWFDLGFGKERVDALLDVRHAALAEPADPPGFEIRRVTPGDGPHLAALSDTIWRHQTQAPRWHPMTPEDIRKQAPGWAEIAETEGEIAYLAFAGQEAVASLTFYPEDEKDDDLTIPPACRYMTAAATRPHVRGRGLSSALAWRGLRQIREEGDAFCLTNWQSANLLAARFWPRFGFKPVAYRLARFINPMIAWAKGD